MINTKLSVIFMYGGRPYLERICRDFLKESLGDYPYKFIDLDCSNLTIGAGFNRLVEQVKTEYVLYTMDDFAFFPNGNWVEKAIRLLELKKDIGIITLRKERDNQGPYMTDRRVMIENISYYIVKHWGDRDWHFSPFIMRTADLKKVVPLNEKDPHGNIAEASGVENFKKVGLLDARLDIPYLGVCFHLGWNRSKARGYKEKL